MDSISESIIVGRHNFHNTTGLKKVVKKMLEVAAQYVIDFRFRFKKHLTHCLDASTSEFLLGRIVQIEDNERIQTLMEDILRGRHNVLELSEDFNYRQLRTFVFAHNTLRRQGNYDFSPDAAANWNRTQRIWSIATLKTKFKFKGNKQLAQLLELSEAQINGLLVDAINKKGADHCWLDNAQDQFPNATLVSRIDCQTRKQFEKFKAKHTEGSVISEEVDRFVERKLEQYAQHVIKHYAALTTEGRSQWSNVAAPEGTQTFTAQQDAELKIWIEKLQENKKYAVKKVIWQQIQREFFSKVSSDVKIIETEIAMQLIRAAFGGVTDLAIKCKDFWMVKVPYS